MNKRILKIAVLFIILIFGLLTIKVEAAYKSNDPTVASGGTITITVKSTESLENYDISLKSYNGLTYVSCSAENAAVNSSTGKISFATLGTGATTLGTYTFKAPEVTETKKYSVVFNINDGETTNTSTVTVNPIKTENTNTSTNNNQGSTSDKKEEQPKEDEKKEEEVKKGTIDTFYINGIKVKQFLNITNKDSVSIKVDTSTKEGATIYNSLTKKSYKVKSGESKNIQILEGTNTLTITLDTGNQETRKIYSQKEEEVEPNIIEEEPEEEVKVTLKSLLIKAAKSEEETVELLYTPEFSSEVYEYNVVLDETLADITKLDIEAIASQEDFTVEIVGNEDLKEGENTITITVKSKDGEKTAQYKLLVVKEAQLVMPVVAEPIVEVEQEQEVVKPLWNRTQQILITVFTSIIALMGIIYAVIEYRYKKEEQEIKIPGAGTTYEEELAKQDNISDIPFAKIGFEKESDDKVDVLKDEKEEIEKEEIEESPKKEKKAKRGKHF